MVYSLARATLFLLTLTSAAACGQDYPSKPIRILASEIGANTDFAARLIGGEIAAGLGQRWVVENRPSNLLGDIFSKAPPDGYTLLIAGGTFTVGPLLQKMAYDPIRDFLPVTTVMRAPNVLVVHPSLPVKSVKELIALAKARPGELNYATGPAGGSPHLAGELFRSLAGVDMVRITYKGGGLAFTDLFSGQVQLMFAPPVSAMPHVKSGRLRALAVTSPTSSPLTPGLPTVAATIAGYESGPTQWVWAPGKTPEPIVRRLNQEIVRVLGQTEVKEKFLANGAMVVGNSPEEAATIVKAETARIGRVVKNAGVRSE